MIAPTIAHTTGTVTPSTVTGRSSGRPILGASQLPITAPRKPIAAVARKPPGVYPTTASAIAPTIAPTKISTNSPIKLIVIVVLLYLVQLYIADCDKRMLKQSATDRLEVSIRALSRAESVPSLGQRCQVGNQHGPVASQHTGRAIHNHAARVAEVLIVGDAGQACGALIEVFAQGWP